MEQALISTNGVRLNVLQDGPRDGPLLIFLHGFPEFSYGWRKQMPFFAAQGYRVWAPDSRGHNLSDKPRGAAEYTLDKLAADVVGLIDAAGVDKANVVGHDWGGAVAWKLGADYPQRLSKLVVLNAPYGSVMLRKLRKDPAQRKRSWYMFYFQLPWLPELTSRRDDWQMLTNMLRRSSLPGTFSDEEIAEYQRAWSLPGAYTGMLGWYRAMRFGTGRRRQPASDGPRVAPVQVPTPSPVALPGVRDRVPAVRGGVPTLLLWGAQDRFLGRELARESISRCAIGQLQFLEDATHWLHHERPDVVNARILAFLGQSA